MNPSLRRWACGSPFRTSREEGVRSVMWKYGVLSWWRGCWEDVETDWKGKRSYSEKFRSEKEMSDHLCFVDSVDSV